MRQRRDEIQTRPRDSQPVFWGGLRTTFGVAQRGALKETRPDDLLTSLLRAHRERFAGAWSGQDTPVDAITGCAYPEGEQGYNIGRVASLGAGLDLPGMTVNRLCGSALEAAAIAASGVASGRAGSWLVAGVESMSRIPRRGANFSESSLVKSFASETYVTMGETAENVARQFPRISRGAQEEFALSSHAAAHRAWADGFYEDHVVGVAGMTRDESIRFPVDPAKMASLPPTFRPDGVVTAATSSPMSDGATAGLVMSEKGAIDSGARSWLRIIDTVSAAVAPEIMGMGPVPAVQGLLRRHSIPTDSIAAVEMNEAFAVQVLACIEALGLGPRIVNTAGGALAIGHPLGASGLRLLMTLQARFEKHGEPGDLGIATLCVGGGQGIAMLCQYVTREAL